MVIGFQIKEKGKVNIDYIIGSCDYNNNDKYNGNWANDMKNGHGKLFCRKLGIMDFANKDKYDGEWLDDRMHGKGLFITNLKVHIIMQMEIHSKANG